jgi:uncharacterized LabA/DUF88 family protein
MKLPNLFGQRAKPRLAILVDDDNISPACLKNLLVHIQSIGKPNIRRIYANWVPRSGWKQTLQILAFEPIQRFAYGQGKNSTDIAMVIDAMDLLHRGKVDGFCLVSNDGDFTPLAIRLKQDGVKVYGFGVVSPQHFINACDEFHDLRPQITLHNGKKTKEAAPIPHAPILDEKVETLLLNAHAACGAFDEWVTLAVLGAEIKRMHPEFSPKHYGYATLRKLITASTHLECDVLAGKHMIVAARPVANIPSHHRPGQSPAGADCI